MDTILDDEYDHIDECLEYAPENVIYENPNNDTKEVRDLRDQFNSILLNPCQCTGTEDCSNCFHGGNYIINRFFESKLVLKPDATDVLYECSSMCKCNPEKCRNRLVQKGPIKCLQIVESSKYGSKGLITIADIPEGAFICEYAGELLTLGESLIRLKANEIAGRNNYILCLRENSMVNAISENQYITIIDPSRKGNVGRYINHSCDPNCKIVSVRIDCPIPKVAIFAKQKIKAGEELCFDYSEGSSTTKQDVSLIPCLCGSKNCLGFLPNISL